MRRESITICWNVLVKELHKATFAAEAAEEVLFWCLARRLSAWHTGGKDSVGADGSSVGARWGAKAAASNTCTYSSVGATTFVLTRGCYEMEHT